MLNVCKESCLKDENSCKCATIAGLMKRLAKMAVADEEDEKLWREHFEEFGSGYGKKGGRK